MVLLHGLLNTHMHPHSKHTHAHTCMHTLTQHTHTHIYTPTRTCTHTANTHVRAHTSMHTLTQHTHTHIHIYTHLLQKFIQNGALLSHILLLQGLSEVLQGDAGTVGPQVGVKTLLGYLHMLIYQTE